MEAGRRLGMQQVAGEEIHLVGHRTLERIADVDVEVAAGVGTDLGVGRTRTRRQLTGRCARPWDGSSAGWSTETRSIALRA